MTFTFASAAGRATPGRRRPMISSQPRSSRASQSEARHSDACMVSGTQKSVVRSIRVPAKRGGPTPTTV
jgi:hypothetical protein